MPENQFHMRKTVLTACILTTGILAAQAQQRLSLYEEFTNAYCGPCSVLNPALEALMNRNTNKAILITYHPPIAGTDPMAHECYVSSQRRANYYSLSFVPQGRLNGTGFGTGNTLPGYPGYIANLTQADLNSDSAAGSPFTMTVAHSWSPAGDSVTAIINIQALSAYTPPGANMKLRVAIVETRHYAKPPGSNGETHFPNVVRQMLPDDAGIQILNSWAVNQSQAYSFKYKLEPTVDKTNQTFIVAWIQNDADKSIPQVAKSAYAPLPLDAGIQSLTVPVPLICTKGTGTMVSPVTTFKNTGTSTLTSARIYYRVDEGPYSSYNWTGTLAPGNNATVTLPPIAFSQGKGYGIPNTNHQPFPGQGLISDSIALPNGIPDINSGNDLGYGLVMVYKDSTRALPLSENFDAYYYPAPGWLILDTSFPMVARKWTTYIGYQTNIGHNNSRALLAYDNGASYACTPDEASYELLPSVTLPSGGKVLEFYLAASPVNSSSRDKLDVVYSTDCGATWTQVWGLEGASLATTTFGKNWDLFNRIPAQSDWAFKSVDMSSVPQGAIIAFRGTCRSGKPYYIDDVTLRENPLGIERVNAGALRLYPNPASDEVTLDASAACNRPVTIKVIDAMGRLAQSPIEQVLSGGQVKLSLAKLPAGLYQVMLQAEGKVWSQRLQVVR